MSSSKEFPRVEYRLAGAAQRRAFAVAVAAGISALELKVLFVICNLTTSWSKLSDRSSARQIAAAVYGVDAAAVSGGQRRRVRDALQRLADAHVIEFTGARGGPHAGVELALPPSNVFSTEQENVSQPEHDDEAERAADRTTTCSARDDNVLRARGNTEKYSEESSERALRDTAQELTKALTADEELGVANALALARANVGRRRTA